jgi:phage baseplate assembly protein V
MSADVEQMAGEVVQLGVVASVDPAAATCTVRLGDLVTGELPWLAARAGALRTWSPPSVGEQVVVLAPEGDLDNGVVLPGLYSDANAAPAADPQIVHLEFEDGAVIRYNQSSHALQVTLPAGATAAIEAPGGVTITGDVTITGQLSVFEDVAVAGTLTASSDVVGGGKSLKSHKHTAVAVGTAQSGPPA